MVTKKRKTVKRTEKNLIPDWNKSLSWVNKELKQIEEPPEQLEQDKCANNANPYSENNFQEQRKSRLPSYSSYLVLAVVVLFISFVSMNSFSDFITGVEDNSMENLINFDFSFFNNIEDWITGANVFDEPLGIQADYTVCQENLTTCKSAGWSAGTTYCLNESIIGNFSGCFAITASDITINGNGFTIGGNESKLGDGISASSKNNITIYDLTIINFTDGMDFTLSSNITIKYVNSSNNNDTGITLNNCYHNNTIKHSDFNSNGDNADSSWDCGIYLFETGGTTVKSCNVTNNVRRGIRTTEDGNNSFQDNVVTNHLMGFNFVDSLNNNVTRNNVSISSQAGIYISYSTGFNLTRNNVTITPSGYSTLGTNKFLPRYLNHDIDTSNTFNDKQVIYYFERENLVLDSNLSSHVTIASCNNITINNIDLRGYDIVTIAYTNNSIFSNLNSNHSTLAYRLENVSYNLFINNTVSNGAIYGGIELYGISKNNTFRNINFTSISSTAFSDLVATDYYNVFEYSSNFSRIYWNKTNLTIYGDLYQDEGLYLSYNRTGLDDNNNYFSLNSSAQIELRGLPYTSNAQLLKNRIRIDNTNRSNITYSGTTLFANISSFSNYSAKGSEPTNTLPIASNVVISSTLSTNLTSENITLTYDVTDADGNPLTNITTWYINNIPLMNLYLPFENFTSNSTHNYSNYILDYSGNKFAHRGDFGGINNSIVARGFSALNCEDGSPEFAGLYPKNNAYSISFWIYPDEDYCGPNPAEWGGILQYGDSSYGDLFNFQHIMANTSCHLNILHGKEDSFTNYSTSGNLTVQKWNHVVVNWDGTTMDVYLNGQSDSAIQSGSGVVNTTAATTTLCDVGTYGFNGKLDEFRIYNRSLSVQQINALYNNLTDVIVSQETSNDDNWQGCIIPIDGRENGTQQCSVNLTVGCTESWSCGDWTVCADSTQTRTCTDANACGTVVNRPALSQSCDSGSSSSSSSSSGGGSAPPADDTSDTDDTTETTDGESTTESVDSTETLIDDFTIEVIVDETTSDSESEITEESIPSEGDETSTEDGALVGGAVESPSDESQEPVEERSADPEDNTQEVEVIFRNGGSTEVVVDYLIVEEEEPIGGSGVVEEETLIHQISESYDLSVEEIEEKVEAIQKIEKENVQPIYTQKTSQLFARRSVIPITGAAISEMPSIEGTRISSVSGMVPTGEHINARLLKSDITGLEGFSDTIIKPNETFESNFILKQGITADPNKVYHVKVISEGKEIFRKEINDEIQLRKGTAVDIDSENKLMDIYMVIPPENGIEKNNTYSLDVSISRNNPTEENLDANHLYSEIHGPFTVKANEGFVFAQQFKYDSRFYGGDNTINMKIYKNNFLIVDNSFNHDFGVLDSGLRDKVFAYVLGIVSIIVIFIGLAFIVVMFWIKLRIRKDEKSNQIDKRKRS